MGELIYNWENLIPTIMIAAGLALTLVGFIGRARRKRSEEMQEDEERAAPRPQMAPLPRLLSGERSDTRRSASPSNQ